MGKIRTRVVGDVETEKEQKEEQKKRAMEKKAQKKTEKAEKIEETSGEKAEVAKESKKASAEPSLKGGSSSGGQKKVKTRGKKYVSAKNKTENKAYNLKEAVALLKKIKYAGFDESVELHLNVKDSGMRGEIALPHSTGRTVRVAIVDDKLLDRLENGVIDFDILITHPSYMPKLAKFARVLGPKGLMPNPKAGTISTNPEDVAKKYSGGLLKWKGEAKFPLVHQMIGKISQEDKQLIENAEKFMQAVGPQNISSVTIKTTMSPGLTIAL